MRALAGLSAAVAMVVAVCVASGAVAETVTADFAGRWRSHKEKLTLDVSRCGSGWCGVTVADDGKCGAIALRLNTIEEGDGFTRFDGRIELAPRSEPYSVQATFRNRDGVRDFYIRGFTGEFQPWRRTFDFQAVFARVSDATCRPDSKVSGLKG